MLSRDLHPTPSHVAPVLEKIKQTHQPGAALTTDFQAEMVSE